MNREPVREHTHNPVGLRELYEFVSFEGWYSHGGVLEDDDDRVSRLNIFKGIQDRMNEQNLTLNELAALDAGIQL